LNPYIANYDEEFVCHTHSKCAHSSGPARDTTNGTGLPHTTGNGNGTSSTNAHTHTHDDTTDANLWHVDTGVPALVDAHKADIWYKRTGFDPRHYPKGRFHNFTGYL
jgi:hypothetical protein